MALSFSSVNVNSPFYYNNSSFFAKDSIKSIDLYIYVCRYIYIFVYIYIYIIEIYFNTCRYKCNNGEEWRNMSGFSSCHVKVVSIFTPCGTLEMFIKYEWNLKDLRFNMLK